MRNQIYTSDKIKHQINEVSIPVYNNICIHAIYNIQGTVDIEMEERPCEELDKLIRQIIANVNDVYTTSC